MPAYNEAAHLGALCTDIETLGYQNICIVNDGSNDETANLQFEGKVLMLHHIINRGVGAATDTGLKYALQHNYQAAITIDADSQHLAADLDNLFQKYNETKADLIIGSRFLKVDNQIPALRRLYNHLANLVTRLYATKYISDTQSGIKLFGPRALQKIHIETDGYEFCSEIIIKALHNKLIIEEVPVTVFYTEYSLSKGQGMMMGLKTVFNLIANLLVKDKN